MGLFVNTNIASINARRNLLGSTNSLNKSYQRLSSGLRVNTAADDAAGLAISERFNSQVRGLNQSVRNANDAVSLVQVAESALQETTAILQRIRELAVQAASDVNTDKDRVAIQDEITQLQDELRRIGETTTFNQQNILDGSFVDKKFHVGMNFRERISVRVRDARAETIGRHAVATSNGAVTSNALAADDLTINGTSIRATQAGTDDAVSTSFAAGSAIAKAAAINDLTEVHGVTAYANETVRVNNAAAGQINGGTLDESNYLVINGRSITGFVVQADDADDKLLNAINAEFERTGVTAVRNGDGDLELHAADGRNIEVGLVGGGVAALTGLTAGVTLSTITLQSEEQFQLGGANESFLSLSNDAFVGVSSVQSVETIDVTTRDGANLALLQVDRAIQQISSDRSELGAVQNRLESTIRNLSAVSENAAAAKSRILDADFAAETAALARNQILQQAATTILAQANQQPQAALSLLQ